MTITPLPPTSRREWISDSDCDLDAFRASVDRSTDLADYPFAHSVERNVLTYRSELLIPHLAQAHLRRSVQTELLRALTDGPGIIVLQNAFSDPDVVDRATEQFDLLIAQQHAAGGVAGDHFGRPGANDRVWNAAQKLALSAPEVFVDYYSNDILALICQSWLGPLYQVTSQVNVVNPGGNAQVPHRDYHLGILPPEELADYPAHLHRMSAALTLQGAVAHCDMPVESGPTLYLPYSQLFDPGYLAFSRPEFIEYFRDNHIQLPLRKGDAVFFNPALYHGAGHNRSATIRRMANLLQVSSPFGRAMEAVDREAMVNAVYPTLLARRTAGASERELRNSVVAAAESYPFPTNLDQDQPVHRLAPAAQVETVWEALQEQADPALLAERLAAQTARRQP